MRVHELLSRRTNGGRLEFLGVLGRFNVDKESKGGELRYMDYFCSILDSNLCILMNFRFKIGKGP